MSEEPQDKDVAGNADAGQAEGDSPTEQQINDSFSEGFNSNVTPKEDDKKKSDTKSKKDADKQRDDNGRFVKTEEETEAKTSDKTDVAKDDLDKRAQDKGFAPKVEQASDSTSVEDKSKQDTTAKDTKSQSASSQLDFISLLPQETVKVGDNEVNLRDFASDFPEAAAMSFKLAEAVVKKALEDAGFAKNEEVSKNMATLNERAFWGDVSETHTGARKTYNSKEFQEWLGKQSPGTIKMAQNTDEPEDMIAIMNQYKPVTEKKKEQPNSRKAELLSGSLQSRRTKVESTSDDDASTEMHEGFLAGGSK